MTAKMLSAQDLGRGQLQLLNPQPGHMGPPEPADLKVLDHSETEEEVPGAIPTQAAKVFGAV